MYGGAFGLLQKLPRSFVPDEDLGYFFVVASLPDGASQERTDAVLKKVEDYFRRTPGVQDVITIGGLNLLSGASSSSAGAVIVTLKPWAERKTKETAQSYIIGSAFAALGQIPEAMIIPVAPPPISGLGLAGGVQFELQDRSGGTAQELEAAAFQFLGAVMQRKELARPFTFFSTRVPQVFVDLDRDKIKTLGVPLDSVLRSSARGQHD